MTIKVTYLGLMTMVVFFCFIYSKSVTEKRSMKVWSLELKWT